MTIWPLKIYKTNTKVGLYIKIQLYLRKLSFVNNLKIISNTLVHKNYYVKFYASNQVSINFTQHLYDLLHKIHTLLEILPLNTDNIISVS